MSQMVDKSQRITIHPLTGRTHVETVNDEPSMTQQQFAEECDINHIMKKYQTTGLVTHTAKVEGRYVDVSEIQDYQAMLDTVLEAQETFMTLPAEARRRFQNDPAELISFLQDENNAEEAVKMGLLDVDKYNATLEKKRSNELKTNDAKKSKNDSPQKGSTSPSDS